MERILFHHFLDPTSGDRPRPSQSPPFGHRCLLLARKHAQRLTIVEIVENQVKPLTTNSEPPLYASIKVVHEARFEKKGLNEDWLDDQLTNTLDVEATD